MGKLLCCLCQEHACISTGRSLHVLPRLAQKLKFKVVCSITLFPAVREHCSYLIVMSLQQFRGPGDCGSLVKAARRCNNKTATDLQRHLVSLLRLLQRTTITCLQKLQPLLLAHCLP